jgi:hypothetical protein
LPRPSPGPKARAPNIMGQRHTPRGPGPPPPYHSHARPAHLPACLPHTSLPPTTTPHARAPPPLQKPDWKPRRLEIMEVQLRDDGAEGSGLELFEVA